MFHDMVADRIKLALDAGQHKQLRSRFYNRPLDQRAYTAFAPSTASAIGEEHHRAFQSFGGMNGKHAHTIAIVGGGMRLAVFSCQNFELQQKARQARESS